MYCRINGSIIAAMTHFLELVINILFIIFIFYSKQAVFPLFHMSNIESNMYSCLFIDLFNSSYKENC